MNLDSKQILTGTPKANGTADHSNYQNAIIKMRRVDSPRVKAAKKSKSQFINVVYFRSTDRQCLLFKKFFSPKCDYSKKGYTKEHW